MIKKRIVRLRGRERRRKENRKRRYVSLTPNAISNILLLVDVVPP